MVTTNNTQTQLSEADILFKSGIAKLRESNIRSALHYFKKAANQGHKKADIYHATLCKDCCTLDFWRDVILAAENQSLQTSTKLSIKD